MKLKAKYFGSNILKGRTPKIRKRNFNTPSGSYHMEKFSAILLQIPMT